MKKAFARRTTATLAAVLASSLTLAACGGGSSSSAGDIKEIKILISAPLTGDSAESGKDMVNGAKLAAEYLNSKGGVQEGDLKGKKYVITSADDQLETEAASTIAAKFASDDGIFAMGGFISSGQAQAAGVVLRKYNLPVVSTFAAADFLTTDADNIAVIAAALGNYSRAVTNFVATDIKAKSVASIAGDYSFLDSYYAGLTDGVATNNLKLASKQSYAEGTADFASLLTRINKTNPDVVLSGAFQADAGKIVAQMRRAGMKQPVVDFLGEGWGQTFADAAGSALSQGDLYQTDPANVFPEKGSLLATEDAAYNKEFGKPIPTAAMHGFDTVLSIGAAIDAGATSKTNLLDYFTKATGEGLLGPIGFTKDLLPKNRVITISKVTGPGPRDRTLAASYDVSSDGKVTKR